MQKYLRLTYNKSDVLNGSKGDFNVNLFHYLVNEYD